MIGVGRMHQSIMLLPDDAEHMIMYGYVPDGRFRTTGEPEWEPFVPAVQVVACRAYAVGVPPVASFKNWPLNR